MDIPIYVAEDKDCLVVAQDTHLEWSHEGRVYERTVPAGYEFKPGIFTETLLLLAAVSAPYALTYASLLHDYLYDEYERDPEGAVSREVADAAMLSDPTDPEWVKSAAYQAVRLFGYLPWTT
jgi:hypothetical protein